MPARKVVIFGIDGGTWPLLDKLMDEGVMPRLKQIREAGICSELESAVPATTPVAWSVFQTGKNPGNFGVFDFGIPAEEIDQLSFVNRLSIKSATMFDYLEAAGKAVTLINLPLSYPVRGKGPVLDHFVSTSEDDFHPASLAAEIPLLKDYKAYVAPAPDAPTYMKDIRAYEAVKMKIARQLWKWDWDLFFMLFTGTDWVQHRHFPELMDLPVAELADQVGVYQDLDEYIGWFADNLPAGTSLLFMSDHGFRTSSWTFYINEWMRHKGYVSIERMKMESHQFDRERWEKGGAGFTAGLGKQQQKQFILNLPEPVIKLIYALRPVLRPIYHLVRKRTDWQLGLSPLFSLDRKKTIAYCPSTAAYGIHLNRSSRYRSGPLGDDEAIEARARIMRDLEELAAEKGQVALRVLLREEIYSGPFVKDAPDILFDDAYWQISHARVEGSYFQPRRSGVHSKSGIFASLTKSSGASGRDLKISLMNIAPTVLQLLGMPIPSDMEAPSFAGMITDDIGPEDYCDPLAFSEGGLDASPDKDEIRKRLEGLGYL